ncbi:MAG: hypothetical protein JNM59_10375 [Hyphomonadaceae bacterium]|nr:hypothetical protein [Hyphomonadaceae bacterium]
MRDLFLAALLVGGCQQAPSQEPAPPAPVVPVTAPLSLEALRADPDAYVRERYSDGQLPGALERDLRAQGFTCAPRGATIECSMAQAAFASCFDVWDVTLESTGSVGVEVNRRCMGATPPSQR